jgi:hypothetical protein
MLLSTTFLAKPMFRVTIVDPKTNNACEWQNIPWLVKEIFCHVMEYFAMSQNNFHVAKEYIKNIPLHGMEFFKNSFMFI